MDTYWQDFARRHELRGQATLIDEWIDPTVPSGAGQRWATTVLTPTGAILREEIDTDASGGTPNPIATTLGWFALEDYWIEDDEFWDMVDAIGAAAVAELVTAR